MSYYINIPLIGVRKQFEGSNVKSFLITMDYLFTFHLVCDKSLPDCPLLLEDKR